MPELKVLTIFISLVVLSVTVLIYVWLLLQPNQSRFAKSFTKQSITVPVIIWWTPFTGVKSYTKECKHGQCLFTEDRGGIDVENYTKAILFYGTDFNVEDLPLPRKHWQWWGLIHEESPKNQPIFDHESVLKLFNITSTFKNASDMPLTLLHLQNIESLLSSSYYVPASTKYSLLKDEKLAPIIYIQSDCDPPSQRDEYVSELSKLIPIDSYGSCLNNRELPSNIRGIESMNHPEIRKLIAKYKFTIAFENSACDDYITEKLWRPLSVGSVPIYWGSPSVKSWLPNNNSIIHVRDYQTPQDLGTHLIKVLENVTLYEEYLEHKTLGTITNGVLLEAMKKRNFGVEEDQLYQDTFVDAFECFVCNHILLYHDTSVAGTFMADKNHYGCPAPETLIQGSDDENNFWLEQWYKAEVEAEVLSRLINSYPGIFTVSEFYEKVIDSLRKKGHFHKFHHNEL